MAVDLRWQAAPRPWEVLGPDAEGRPLRIRIGQQIIARAAVRQWRTERVAEPNVDGYLATVALFMAAGALFVVPVLMQLLEPRFLLGAVLFIAIGMTAIGDLWRGHLIDLVRVHIELTDGQRVTFSTCDVGEAKGLLDALAQAHAPTGNR